MNKKIKNSLIIIAIVVAVFVIIWLLYDIFKQEPAEVNTSNFNMIDENTGLENIINELFENVVVNESTEDKSKEKIKAENNSVTSKEEKAIQLVKEKWGEDEGVYFSNESIDSQGRYIVSVRNKKTTDSLAFFVVDVDKELVTKR